MTTFKKERDKYRSTFNGENRTNTYKLVTRISYLLLPLGNHQDRKRHNLTEKQQAWGTFNGRKHKVYEIIGNNTSINGSV